MSTDSAPVLGLVLEITTVQANPHAEQAGQSPTVPVSRLVWLQEADEAMTLGQLVARFGLEGCEQERITLRWPTPREEAQRLAELIDQQAIARAREAGILNCAIYENGAAIAFRDEEGRIVDEHWQPMDADDSWGE